MEGSCPLGFGEVLLGLCFAAIFSRSALSIPDVSIPASLAIAFNSLIVSFTSDLCRTGVVLVPFRRLVGVELPRSVLRTDAWRVLLPERM